MSQPSVIVYSSSDVSKVPMTDDANTFTASNTFAEPVVITKAIGTAPLTITSTTKVTNLNVEQVDGADLDTDGALTANSDVKIASQKATKTYADTKAPALGADDNYVTDTQKADLTSGGGVTGSFTTVDLKTVTYTNGIITSVV